MALFLSTCLQKRMKENLNFGVELRSLIMMTINSRRNMTSLMNGITGKTEGTIGFKINDFQF